MKAHEGSGVGTPPRARLAAVVLNYRSATDTLLAVYGLLRARRPPDVVYVVDNDGDDPCLGVLAPVLPRIRYLATGQNLGFPGGMNAGIRAALEDEADLVVLVNSDAVVAPDCLGTLEAALAHAPAVGIVAPLLIARANPDVVASAGLRFDARTGRMRHLAAGARRQPPANPLPQQVDAVSGCVMVVRAEVFRAIDLLDEAYFFSFEDLEFCLRARREGFECAVVPAAIACHEGGRSIGPQSPRRLYFAARNHLRLAAQAAPTGPLHGVLRALIIVVLTLAFAVRAPGASVLRRVEAVLRGVRDHVAGRYGPA